MKKSLILSFLLLHGGTALFATEPGIREPLSHFAIRTNLLHDGLAVPNLGVEVFLPHEWSVAASVDYAWWSSHTRKRCWRYAGVELDARHWLGSAPRRTPYTGHHLGIFGQCYTYDFQWNGHGYLGGRSHGKILEKPNYSFGLEYGYTFTVGRRLHLDLNVGLGYAGGRYEEYRVVDAKSMWQQTVQRRWFGPTKADISLVWFLPTGVGHTEKGGGP